MNSWKQEAPLSRSSGCNFCKYEVLLITRGTGSRGCFTMEFFFRLLEDIGVVILIAVSLGGFAASVAWAFALFVGKQS